MPDNSATSRGVGGRIGGKVAAHVANAVVSSRAQSAFITRNVARLVWKDFFDGTGAELRNSMGPLFKQLADDPSMDANLRPLFKFLARGQGELATLIGYTVAGGVVSQGLGAFITNALEPVVGPAIAGFPNMLLTQSDAVQAEARGMQGAYDMRYEVRQQGIDSGKFDVLVDLARNRADATVILDLVNRGIMTEDFAVAQLRRLGYDTGEAGFILATRRLLLTPAELADMVVRGIATESDAAAVAAQSGLSTEDFHALVLDTGEPPSTQDLLFLHRRGFIDQARLERGIHQSRVRDEWIDAIEALSFVPMSTADAVEGAVQGHLTIEQSKAITAQNGLLPEHWQPLYENAGNPPGVQEMISMWHRGVLTRDQLVAGIRESRLKDKYIDFIIAAGETLPPERTIVSMVSKNAITPARGMTLLLERGYAPDIAQALLSEAHSTKTAATRDLTQAQFVALYEDRAITAQQLHDFLAKLKYDDEEIAWLQMLADLRRLKKFTDAAIAKIHTQYVSYRLSSTDATTALDALLVDPNQRNDLLALWDIERTVNAKQLTLAEIMAAHKKGIISDMGAYQRIQNIGYSADDAAVLLETAGVPPANLGR